MEKGHGAVRAFKGVGGTSTFVCIGMALMTFLEVFEAIRLHSQPILSCSENFLSHGVPIGMCVKGSLVNFFDKHDCFVSI